MKFFVTGRDGLVGRELERRVLRRGGRIAGGDLPHLDVTRPDDLARQVRAARPDWVVNLAAWTEVDACEDDPLRAERVNATGALHAARAARAAGARILHVSTDYVFDGAGSRPYREDDHVRPLSAYGRSKWHGEQAVRRASAGGRWTIVRAQSLYGSGRKSFPDAILRAAAAKPSIPVVTDQVVSPTWARDLAAALLAVTETGASGVFHCSAAGSCSWNEFARAVLAEAGVDVPVTAIDAASLGRPAPRPAWSVFDCGRLERSTGHRPRPWREQLRDYLRSTGRAA